MMMRGGEVERWNRGGGVGCHDDDADWRFFVRVSCEVCVRTVVAQRRSFVGDDTRHKTTTALGVVNEFPWNHREQRHNYGRRSFTTHFLPSRCKKRCGRGKAYLHTWYISHIPVILFPHTHRIPQRRFVASEPRR